MEGSQEAAAAFVGAENASKSSVWGEADQIELLEEAATKVLTESENLKKKLLCVWIPGDPILPFAGE